MGVIGWEAILKPMDIHNKGYCYTVHVSGPKTLLSERPRQTSKPDILHHIFQKRRSLEIRLRMKIEYEFLELVSLFNSVDKLSLDLLVVVLVPA